MANQLQFRVDMSQMTCFGDFLRRFWWEIEVNTMVLNSCDLYCTKCAGRQWESYNKVGVENREEERTIENQKQNHCWHFGSKSDMLPRYLKWDNSVSLCKALKQLDTVLWNTKWKMERLHTLLFCCLGRVTRSGSVFTKIIILPL